MKFLCMCYLCLLAAFNSSAIKADTKQNTTITSDKLDGSQFGCTCAGLIACEAALCTAFLGGLVCTGSSGRADVICMCKKGGLKHCTNWDDIINDPHCKRQNEDYQNNNCGDCSC